MDNRVSRQVEIRILNPQDAEIFRAIRLEAIREVPGAFAEPAAETGMKSLEDYANYLEPHGRGNFVLGAFDGYPDLIGVIGFYRESQDKLLHKGTIWGMYVRPAYRRKGVAAALLAEAIETVRKLPGVRQIHLSVSDDNEAAKALYGSFGFRTYGVEIGALKIDGGYVDEQLMLLPLA